MRTLKRSVKSTKPFPSKGRVREGLLRDYGTHLDPSKEKGSLTAKELQDGQLGGTQGTREFIALGAVNSGGFSFDFRLSAGIFHPHDLSRRIAASCRLLSGR